VPTTPRERTEEIERDTLAPHATLASASKGRERDEPQDLLRTCFQRDRDRIVHSKAFRRLKHKTQVFLAPEGDHYRVRLTHTLEVSQIARTAARALRLNEDLVEAIALGHDLGHTRWPGQQALRSRTPLPAQRADLRIVDHLEARRGLNLTWRSATASSTTWSMPQPSTLEAQVVRYADRAAYVNHDVDDAVRAGVLEQGDLPAEAVTVLGRTHSERVNTLVTDLVERSSAGEDVGPEIRLSDEVFRALDVLREFLFERVYLRDEARTEQDKAIGLVRALFGHYLEHPEQVPEEYHRAPGDLPTRVADYIAGMTDRYALRTYEQLFLPQSWLL
jgi:dGTPase